MKKGDFFNDLGIKVAALILALIIWFHATTEKNYTQVIEMPVTYSYQLPDSLILLSMPPRSVRLRVSAKGKSLLKLKYTKNFYRVEVGKLEIGKNIFDMSQGDIPGVEDVDILEVLPHRVLFLVDKYSTKVLYSIRPLFVYDSVKTRVKLRRLSARTVRVRGPRTIIRTLRYAVTDSIFADTLNSGDYTLQVAIKSPVRLVHVLKPRTTKVSFSVLHFNYDTLNVQVNNEKYDLFLKYPDTLTFFKDSINCTVDSMEKPSCTFQQGVTLLNIQKK